MFYLINDDEEIKSFSRRTTMKKRTLLLTFIGIILFACGGGGGGGSGSNGTGNTGTISYNTLDYFQKDASKVYTYNVSESTSGNQQTTDTTWVYHNESKTIPVEYGYSGSITGPYIAEILTIDGTVNTVTYKSSSGDYILKDQSGTYTINDAGHTTSTGEMPAKLSVGTEFTINSTEDLLNSDPDHGTVGEKIGTMITVYTVKMLAAENVTVNTATYEALKTQETTSTTIMNSGGTTTMTINTSSNVWYGNGVGPVKIVANNTYVSSGSTSTSSVTSELLTCVSP
jgi:hypothetical protein